MCLISNRIRHHTLGETRQEFRLRLQILKEVVVCAFGREAGEIRRCVKRIAAFDVGEIVGQVGEDEVGVSGEAGGHGPEQRVHQFEREAVVRVLAWSYFLEDACGAHGSHEAEDKQAVSASRFGDLVNVDDLVLSHPEGFEDFEVEGGSQGCLACVLRVNMSALCWG